MRRVNIKCPDCKKLNNMDGVKLRQGICLHCGGTIALPFSKFMIMDKEVNR